MDLLYSRYASPLEFMGLYMQQGRFGEFVSEITQMEAERKKDVEQKENDKKLWEAYIHSLADKSFHDWKKEMTEETKPGSYAMTDEQVETVKQRARGILSRISPPQTG